MDAIDTEILSILQDGPMSATEVLSRMTAEIGPKRMTSRLNSLRRYGLVWISEYRSCRRPLYSAREPSGPVEPLPLLRGVILDALKDGPKTVREMSEETGRDIGYCAIRKLESQGLIIRAGYEAPANGGNLAVVWRRAA